MAFLFFDASKSDILTPNAIGSEHLKPVLMAISTTTQKAEESGDMSQGTFYSPQEAVFLNLTSQMHSLRPESRTKILYYWSFEAIPCYQSTEK